MKKTIISLILLFTCFYANAATPSAAKAGEKSIKVACCDWMILKRQKLGEFKLSSELGADGVELDMGSLGRRVLFESKFRPKRDSLKLSATMEELQQLPDVKTFREEAAKYNLEFSSVAMSGFYAQSFLKRDNYVDLVQDALNTAQLFSTKVLYLPMGGSGTTWQEVNSEDYGKLVERLHTAGEMAKKAGCVIGIRTGMPAEFDLQLLKKVKSEGIKIYYSVQVACDRTKAEGYKGPSSTDIICKELKLLGTKNICQIHISNTDGQTLRNDKMVDMPRIKAALAKIKYKGWLVIERSRNANDARNVKGNYSDNVSFLHDVFK